MITVNNIRNHLLKLVPETWTKVKKIVKLPVIFTTLVRLNKFIVGID